MGDIRIFNHSNANCTYSVIVAIRCFNVNNNVTIIRTEQVIKPFYSILIIVPKDKKSVNDCIKNDRVESMGVPNNRSHVRT